MSDDFQEDLHFEAADDAADIGEGLLLDIDGYEGPLHLLLELARKQKVDLARISILALAEQYLAFIKAAENLRIELAADYLVMASWLAYLKSRLILPKEGAEEQLPEEDELAAHLAFRLQRLEARTRLRRALASVGVTDSETWTSFDALLPAASELKDGLPSVETAAAGIEQGVVDLTERLRTKGQGEAVDKDIRLLEALLFAAVEPIDIETLRERMPEASCDLRHNRRVPRAF